MRRLSKMIPLLSATLMMLPQNSALAQDRQEKCVAGQASVPAALTPWSTPRPSAAAASKAELKSAALAVGSAVDAALKPAGDVRCVSPPEKPGGSVSFGGMFTFAVREAGTYRVALGSGAWVDVLKGGKVVESSAHGHGPACSGIRKMVDFPLKPGTYTLQVAASGSPNLRLLIARMQ